MAVKEEIKKQKPKRLETFGDDFTIVEGENGPEITNDFGNFEVVCVWPDHPYCQEAEDYFTVTASLSNRKKHHKDQRVKIYLRDKDTFQVEEVVFIADITQKRTGVQSGIITNPFGLAGLMCAPPVDGGNCWTVFRPFNRDFTGSTDPSIGTVFDLTRTDIAREHILRLPKVSFDGGMNLISPVLQEEYRDVDFARLEDGIISLAEKNTYFTQVNGVCFEEYGIEEDHQDLYPLVSYGEYQVPTNTKVFALIIGALSWPDTTVVFVNEFSGKPKSSNYHFEFIRGEIVDIGGSYYFKPDTQTNMPPRFELQLYMQKEASVRDIREEQNAAGLKAASVI